MKKAIIHIGIEKTGTTSIQTCMNWNREVLRKYGIGYLLTPGIQNNRKLVTYCMNNTTIDDYVKNLGICESESRQLWKENFYKEINSELNLLANKVCKVIISSEHFHSRLKSFEEINILKNLLINHFDSCSILVYLRRQDFLALSVATTRTIAGSPLFNYFPSKINSSNHYFNFENLLDKWGQVFGKDNVNVRIYDRNSLYQRDLLQDFFLQTGLEAIAQHMKIPPLQNTSLSSVTLRVISRFNTHYPKYIQDTLVDVNQQMRQDLIKILESKFHGINYLPNRESAETFYKNFSASNIRVAKKWLNKDLLFEEDFSMYPEAISEVFLDQDQIVFIHDSIVNIYQKYEVKGNEELLQDLSKGLSFPNPSSASSSKYLKDRTFALQSLKLEEPKNSSSAGENAKIKILLHIGQPKTGSSSIQEFLDSNRKSLFQNYKILYPNFSNTEFDKGFQTNHASIFIEAQEAKNYKACIETFKKCKIYCENHNISKIVISNEGFMWRWWPNLIRQIVDSLDCDLQLILYLRRQDYYVESAWKQWGHKENAFSSIMEYAKKLHLNWEENLNTWLKFFPKQCFVIRPFEKEVIGDNVVTDFLNIIGINDFGFLSSPNSFSKVNVGFTPEIIEILQLCAKITKSVHDHTLLKLFENALPQLYQKKSTFDSYGLLSPKEKYELVLKYNDSNNRIANRFFDSTVKNLFNEPWPNPNEHWEAKEVISIEAIVPVFMSLFIYQQEKINALDNKLQNLIISSNNSKIDYKGFETFIKEKFTALNKLPLIENKNHNNPVCLKDSGYNNEFSKINSTNLQLDLLYKRVRIKNQICLWELTDEGLMLSSKGNDPYLVIPKSVLRDRSNEICIEITAPMSTILQVFYKTKFLQKFKEANSIRKPLKEGKNFVNIVLEQNSINNDIRIDPGNIPGNYIIHSIFLR
jgi:hypothetical protein